MKKAFITFIFAIICIYSKSQPADTLKFISLKPAEFMDEMKSSGNAILVDVREFFEFRKSRIKNAINIPASGNFREAADTLGKTKDLFLYCTSGFRSKRVAKSLSEKGFLHLYSLEGGITAWKKEGFHIERKRIRKKE